ncbi:MAG: ABC transporter ATP-binding protein [Ruminococcus sp.]|nr:ABC transporter ATP-binding protein [Ruminococcus sp.]
MNSKENTIKWLWEVPEKKKFYILLLTIFQSLIGASGVLYAFLMKNIVDTAAAHAKQDFYKNIIFIITLTVAQIVFRAFIRKLEELSRSTFENIFKKRLLRNIMRKDFGKINAVHSGEWLNRLTNDTVVVATNYTDIIPGLSGMIVKLVSAFVMMIVLDRRFALIIVPGGIVLGILTYAFRKVLKRLHKNMQEKDGKLRIFLQERISSMMIIRSFAAENQIEEEADEKMTEHKAARMRKNRFSNVCNIGFAAAMNGMYLFGTIYCGYGILVGTLSYGMLTAITQLISQIQAPFANITGYLPKFYTMTASAERLMEIEKFGDDLSENTFSLSEINDIYNGKMKCIGLKNADFTYYSAAGNLESLTKENQPEVLNNISFTINKGEYVALTGHSGCGKSTALKLLMCIYKLDGGERFITYNDGTTHELNSEYHRLFAYIPQGNQLMSGTVRDIVSFADKSQSDNDEKIMKALEIACAGEFISGLENGIDTLLGERGAGLSEGQMQRIAVARAIFSDSPVLLLDESTSALDQKSEEQLLKNLREMTDKTVIIITHRPAALEICDRILNFTENGVVELEACPDEEIL